VNVARDHPESAAVSIGDTRFLKDIV